MKAALLNGYDRIGRDLEVRDVPRPTPNKGEALVRVLAAGVNPLDNMIVRGEVKLIVPYRFPLVMGNELVGIVEELGAGAGGFETGDRVYCRMPLAKIGAFAVDRMAAKRGQRYLFVFVHEDGAGLAEVSRIFEERRVQASVDEVFELADVNEAMRKVAAGGSRGKTVLRVARS